MKYLYIALCILGTILPYSQFIPWLADNGLNMGLLVQEAAQLRIGAFAWLDALVSVVVVYAFILYEGRQLDIKKLWLPMIGTITVGVSLGLPLFLLMRELRLEQQEA